MKKIGIFIFALICIQSCSSDFNGVSPKEYIERENLTATELEQGAYIVIENEGSSQRPQLSDGLLIDYRAIVAETGETFDEGEDLRFNLGSSLLGWQIGLQEVGEGGSCTLILPPALAFGEREFDNLPKNSTVVFDITIKEIVMLTDVQGYVDRNNLDTEILDQGVQIHIIEMGNDTFPTDSSNVQVNYIGKFTNEVLFDQGTEVSFNLGGLIEGWKIGLQEIGEGGKCILVLPAETAYGAQGSGSIPPDTPIVFEIDLIDVIE